MIIGYVRSRIDSSVEEQRLAIYDAGYKPDFWYDGSKSITQAVYKKTIKEILDQLKTGDLLVVTELTRLGRTTGQIAVLVDQLLRKEVKLYSLKEGLAFDGFQEGEKEPSLAISIIKLFANIERDLISENTKKGIEQARKNGKPIGRPKGKGKSKLDVYRDDIAIWLRKGLSFTAISKLTGFSITAVSHYIKTRELQSPKKQYDAKFWEKMVAGYKGSNTAEKMKVMFEHLMEVKPVSFSPMRREMCEILKEKNVSKRFALKSVNRLVELNVISWDGDLKGSIEWK